MDVELLHLDLAAGLGGSDNGGIGALGDNGNAGAAVVLLGQLSQLLGDLDDIVGAPAVALGVGTSLGLVAEGVVGVGQNGVELVLEELRDEGSGQREHEDLVGVSGLDISWDVDGGEQTNLVLGSGLLTQSLDGRDAHRQVVATDVVHLGLLGEGPDVGLLQVLELVLVGGSQVGAHATVVSGDDHTTLAGGLGLIDTVLGVDTGGSAGLLEDVGVLVLADAANVADGVFGEHVLKEAFH